MSLFTPPPSSDGTSVHRFASKKLCIFFVITVLITTVALILFTAEFLAIKRVRAYISEPLLRMYPEWKQKRNKKGVVAFSDFTLIHRKVTRRERDENVGPRARLRLLSFAALSRCFTVSNLSAFQPLGATTLHNALQCGRDKDTPNGWSFNRENTATRERESLETRRMESLLVVYLCVLAVSDTC
jgi:hypothetical protein